MYPLCLIPAIEGTIAQNDTDSMVFPMAGYLEDPTVSMGMEESIGLNLHVFLVELQGRPSATSIQKLKSVSRQISLSAKCLSPVGRLLQT